MRCIQFLLVCLINLPLLAQEKEIKAKYGKINEEEVKMKFYSRDSSAEAVLLYEEGEITFSYDDLSGIKMILNYFGRYKILKTSGLERGVIKIPLYEGSYNERELLRNVDGCTYNFENGKIVSSKLTKAAIFHEHVVDKEYQEKLSMPNLKEGSVFEYRYTKETPFSVKYIPDTWFFQSSIPIQWSELSVEIPRPFNYRILKGGYLPFVINEKTNTITKLADLETSAEISRFAVKYAPAFRRQEYVTSLRDYKSKVEFELTNVQIPGKANINYSGTWDDLSITLLKSQYYEETFRRTNFLKSEIQNLKNIKDTMQCIQEAFDYVSKTLEWNNTVSVFSQTDAAKVFENKKGSATEINLILVSLLKAAGLNASPVIISTRSNGKISELYPSLNQFNYTIACVEVNGKDILMDATDRYTKPGMLPERCLNRTGRLIKREGSRFVSLEPTAIRVKVETITASIDPGTGEIKGNLVTSNAGYNGHDIKESIKEEGEENIIKRIKKQNAEWEIENFKLENKEGAEEVKIIFDFRIPENVSTDIIYLNPLLSGKIVNNPFTEQNRIYPVDLTTGSDEVVISTIKIPEEYKVEELPVSVNVALPDNLGKFSYKIVNEGNSVKVMSRIKMNEYLFQPAEYDMLRNFYDNIVQKHAEQIVIKRVKK